MSKFQGLMQRKIFSGKQKKRFVQNIMEVNQLLMDNPNAGDGRQKLKKSGIFGNSKKKGDKYQEKLIPSNKFYI
jgi:hypothetical protein